jgi:hypothetical protein
MDQVSGGFGIRERTSRDSKDQCVSLAAFKIEGLLSRITKRQDILNLYVWESNTLTMIPESHVNTSYPILNQHPLHHHLTNQTIGSQNADCAVIAKHDSGSKIAASNAALPNVRLSLRELRVPSPATARKIR